MDLLQQARAEIDTVDAEMAALFERRMRAVADVVRYKAETGKPVFDAAPPRAAPHLQKNNREGAKICPFSILHNIVSGKIMLPF